MLKKLLIIPWFGPYPEWLHKWVGNIEYLKYLGYDWKIYSNVELFEERVVEILGINPNITPGSGKPWDFRPTFGELFADDLKGYDYWGHTDLDCVYGDVSKFIPDSELSKYDIWTNDVSSICGPWTLYKNSDNVNKLFRKTTDWRQVLTSKDVYGWEENGFSGVIDTVKVRYGCNQTKDWNNFDTLRFDDGRLFEGEEEVMTAHFRRTKKYPL